MTLFDLFGCVGLTFIVVASAILRPVRQRLKSSPRIVLRKLGELMSCSLCTGFWVGVWFGADGGWTPARILLCAGLVSWVSYAVDLLLLGLVSLTGER